VYWQKKVKLRCSWSVVKSWPEDEGAEVMETNWDRGATEEERDDDRGLVEFDL
jgi:hypothetical protein